MNLSWTVRILLIIGGLVVGVVGLAMWADESEHGGWAALDGYERGYLADGSVEVRQVPWSNPQDEMSGTYEVRPVEGDTYEVTLSDPEGAALFTGSSAEVAAWLDDQGDQVYVGTEAEVTAWTNEQRSTEKSFIAPAIVIGLGMLLVIVAVIPRRGPAEPRPKLTTPHTSGT